MVGDGDDEDDDRASVDQQEPLPRWQLTRKLAILTALEDVCYFLSIAKGYGHEALSVSSNIEKIAYASAR